MRTRRLPSRGFTFIEMMVVVAILGLLSALVVVNLDGVTAHSQLSRSARDLGNKLQFLRDVAVVQSREMGLEIDIEHQRWREVDRPSAAEFPDPDEREDETFYGSWYEMPDGVSLEEVAFGRHDAEVDSRFELSFNERGELFPSGFVAYLTHEKLGPERGLSVEVSGLTGAVDYRDGHVEAEEVRDENDF
mgnify:CR=1 FL=1